MSHTLDEDSIAHILYFCDIQTVISVSKVCRSYYTAAFSRAVWLSIITNLKSRFLLDLPVADDVSTLPTLSLVELAKRAVKGPKSWSPSYLGPPKVLIYQQFYEPHIAGSSIKHLPGGRYMLENGACLRCWSFPEGRLIWQYQPQDNQSVIDFAAEVVDEGRTVMIGICDRNCVRFENNVRIVRLDLDAETAEVLLVVALPYTKFDNVFSSPRISGDLVVVNLNFLGKIVVINLETKLHAFLRLPGNSDKADVECIPGHIVAIKPGFWGRRASIAVWSIASLEGYWVHSDNQVHVAPSGRSRRIHRRSRLLTSSLSIATSLTKIHQPTHGSPLPLFSDTIDMPDPYSARRCHLSAHASPLRDDSYRIWVHIDIKSGHLYHAKKSCTIIRYQITLNPTSLQASISKIDPHDLNTRHLDLGRYRGISYAGHTNTYHWQACDKVNIISCTELDRYEDGELKKKGLIQLPGYVVPVISSHSGSLAFPKDQQVIVRHYE